MELDQRSKWNLTKGRNGTRPLCDRERGRRPWGGATRVRLARCRGPFGLRVADSDLTPTHDRKGLVATQLFEPLALKPEGLLRWTHKLLK